MRSSQAIKTGIRKLSETEKSHLKDDILSLDVKGWRYVFDTDRERFGPILEEMPKYLQHDKLTIDVVTMLGALVATVQQQQKELNELRERFSAPSAS